MKKKSPPLSRMATELRCKKHPKYLAKRQPTTDCKPCRLMFDDAESKRAGAGPSNFSRHIAAGGSFLMVGKGLTDEQMVDAVMDSLNIEELKTDPMQGCLDSTTLMPSRKRST